MTLIEQFGAAFILTTVIVALALWRGSLSLSGGIGAFLIGIAIFGFGGWVWGVLLGIFFISSTLLSHFKEEAKKAVSEKFDKGHKRDMGQVFANGGAGALLAIGSFFTPSPIWFILFIGAMATVTADTWATELGTLNSTPPRLITTGQIVEVGTSGGITLYGTAVSLLGGLIIGLVAGLLTPSGWQMTMLIGGVGGISGSLLDSLLGATVQAVYYSDLEFKETEKKLNSQGQPNRLLRGFNWMTNDLVNFTASLGGAFASFLIYTIWIMIQ
jgi:uncharacterized protein (TIGR00297 family)